jgi:hypothetical protein
MIDVGDDAEIADVIHAASLRTQNPSQGVRGGLAGCGDDHHAIYLFYG